MKPNLLFQKRKQSTPISAKMQQISRLLLTNPNRSPYAFPAFAKSKAGRGNPNKHQANDSTPLTRAFFVRSSSTPKERYIVACSSMVACSGQGLALGCTPDVAVFHPVASYRPLTVESEAIALINQHQELSAMKQFAYFFLCVNRNADIYQEEIIRIIADSEQNARFQLHADYRLVLDRPIKKIAQKQPPLQGQHFADFPQNLTPCNHHNRTQGGVYA